MVVSPSVVTVLVAGNLAGALIKGITGFGSAIINLCVWIAATCLGINAGTLQQAVLTECVASEVVAIPLLCMTRAHATCDWALVLSLSIFGAVGAPIGAAMLTHLPPRQVEFAVGCLMLLVILLNCLRKKPTAPSSHQQEGCAATEMVPAAVSGHVCISTAGQRHKQLNSCSVELPVVVIQEGNGSVHSLSIRSPHTLEADCVSMDAAQLSAPVHSPEQGRSTSRASHRSSLASDEHCTCIVHPEQQLDSAIESDLEGVALLHSAGKQPLSSDIPSHSSAVSQVHQGEAAAPAQAARLRLVDRVQRWWSAVTQPDKLLALRRMLMMGSVAGTASGVMAGLTGMGGPPAMLMFERLQIPKDTIRGTNAICNIIQIRIFAYLAMGVFARSDLALYIAVSVAALVGMFVGCMAAARTNQATFSHMLTALMVMCCVLMFASAAGIAGGSSSPVGHSTS